MASIFIALLHRFEMKIMQLRQAEKGELFLSEMNEMPDEK